MYESGRMSYLQILDPTYNSIQLGFSRAHSEQAVIAHVHHGQTLQLSTGLSV